MERRAPRRPPLTHAFLRDFLDCSSCFLCLCVSVVERVLTAEPHYADFFRCYNQELRSCPRSD